MVGEGAGDMELALEPASEVTRLVLQQPMRCHYQISQPIRSQYYLLVPRYRGPVEVDSRAPAPGSCEV